MRGRERSNLPDWELKAKPACAPAPSISISGFRSQPPGRLQVLQHFCRIAPGGPAPRTPAHTEKDCQSAPSYKKLLADNDPWHSHPLDWKLMPSSLMSPPAPQLPRAPELICAGWLVFWVPFLNPPRCTSRRVSQRWRLPICFCLLFSCYFKVNLTHWQPSPRLPIRWA